MLAFQPYRSTIKSPFTSFFGTQKIVPDSQWRIGDGFEVNLLHINHSDDVQIPSVVEQPRPRVGEGKFVYAVHTHAGFLVKARIFSRGEYAHRASGFIDEPDALPPRDGNGLGHKAGAREIHQGHILPLFKQPHRGGGERPVRQ